VRVTLLLLLACKPPKTAAPPTPRGDALYFAMVDRFADGAPDAPGTTDVSDPQAWHGGDIAGLIERVPWLDAQGYGALWISPITRARTEPIGEWGAYHGYWMLEPDAVEPRFGTQAQLEELSAALHERGMGLYLDMVVNHLGYDSPRVEAHPDWFHHNGDINDWGDAKQVVEFDVHGLHDLAQELPEVADWLGAAGEHWVRTVRPNGFRIDAVRHVPPGFLAEYGDRMREAYGAPGFQLLGEVLDGNPSALAERARSDRLDSQFDFPLMYGIQQSGICGDADYQRVAANLFTERHLPTPPPGPLAPLVTLLDNHDVPRIASLCDQTGPALAFLYGVRGTPSITWGTEAGLDAAHEPENRADMPWGEPMPLQGALAGLNQLRARWPALRDGQQAVAELSPRSIRVVRWLPDQTVWVVHHRSLQPLELSPAEAWLLTDTTLEPWDGGPFAGTLLARLDHAEGFDTAPRVTTLRVGPVELVEDEKLYVVGSAPELGGWRADRAVPVTDSTAEIRMPGGTATAAKLVVVGSKSERWSQAQDVTVLAGGSVSVPWE